MDDQFAPSNAAQPPPHIHRPIPRRTFGTTRTDSADSPTHDFSQATPPSATETRRSSDFLSQLNARLLRTYNSRNEDGEETETDRDQGLPARNKSFLNMTTSTLFGIYDDVTSSAASMAETPWGTGAETPAHTAMGHYAYDSGLGSPGIPDAGISMKTQARRRQQHGKAEGKRKAQSPKRPRNGAVKHAILGLKLAALFLFGVAYGLIVSHLHDTRQLQAVHVEGMDRENWIYLASWGCFGVALGSLLPYVDIAWSGHTPESEVEQEESEADSQSPMSEQINDVVRSVAAFVGIAFAIVSRIVLRFSGNYANIFAASTPMAVHSTAHLDTRPRKSRALVHTRPLEAGSLMFPHRNIDPYIFHILVQPGRSAFTIFAINS
jgi:hypothetical protein